VLTLSLRVFLIAACFIIPFLVRCAEDYSVPLSITNNPDSTVTKLMIGGYKVFFGNTHNHSMISDGVGSPEEAYSYARNIAKLDFFSLSDHCYSISLSEWAILRDVADRFTRDSLFIGLWGFEWTSREYLGHVSVINTEDYCTVTDTATDSFLELVEWLSSRNGVAFFNHPGRENVMNTEFSHFETSPSEKFVGMELWNKSDGFSVFYYGNGYFYNDNGRGFYDEALIRGWKIGASGAEDNHTGNWGTATNYRLAILANALTRAELVKALKARRFYSTLDKNLALSFKINNQEMGSTVKPGSYTAQILAIDGSKENFTEVIMFNKNHAIAKDWILNTPSVNITCSFDAADSGYYYIKIKQEDGDEAISSPIWISADTYWNRVKRQSISR
jgi:hypothetical protein